MSRGGRSLGGRAEAVAGVMRAPQLRRLQMAWGAFFLFDGIALVALSVWAFAHDGASAVGLVGLARLLPGAMALPFGAWAADRFPRRRVVGFVFSAITVVQTMIAIALATDAPAVMVYLLVGLSSVAAAPYRPAHLALAPLVARSPQELVAMNVTAGTVEGLVTFLGPAIAALLLLVAGPWVVVTAAAGAALMGSLAVLGLNVDVDPSKAVRRSPGRPTVALLGGINDLAANTDMAAVVSCFIIQLLVRGVLNVLVVSVSFDLIDLDSSGVGWLAASMGIGGIAGGIYAVSLTGRRRLARPFAIALVLWGAPIAVVGIVPNTVVALAALFAVGVGNALLDVSGFTLIQRLGRDRTLGRVFGVMFTFGIALGGVGSLAAPPLVRWLGLRPVLMIVGLVLPATTVLLLRRFRSIDQRSEPLPEVLALLAASPLLSPLPPTSLEKLAARSRTTESPAGKVIVAEGDRGDLFYVIVDGEVEVFRAGQRHRTLGPGDQFGEIALLHNVNRTATIVTTRFTRMISIEGDDFVDALSSSDAAFAAGSSVAAAHLAHEAPD
ncbi:MAG TPA: MFS transporter [Ilumatobacteraceae bacterium]|nr:MFS transporter [Ilumatobacteraceae bacterium]